MDFTREYGSGTIPSFDTLYDAQWREEDMEQRMLENARLLWERHAEDNRQALEEHAEYVRSMATLSAFMAGFVNIAFIQFNFESADVPYPVLMGFSVTNAITTAVNTCCMATCTLILGSIFRTFTSLLSEEEEAAFIMRCRAFAKGYQVGNKPPTPPRNFRNHWEFFCRSDWQWALCLFSTGIGFFLVNTAFAAFIKFDAYRAAAVVLCCGLAPGLLLCTYLHIKWLPYLLDSTASKPVLMEQQRQALGMPFDWHLPGVKAQTTAFPAAHCAGVIQAHPGGKSAGVPQWRLNILEQRTMNNATHLWQRFVRKTRNEVEERVEQLRSFAFLSGVLAGFAVASLLQLEFQVEETKRSYQIWFALSAGLTAACSTCSMAMCSLMLMSVIKMSRGLTSQEEEARFLSDCLEFARTYSQGSRPPAPKRTFRNHWARRCEGEWARAFYLFALGLGSYVVNTMAGVWIKYTPFNSVSTTATVVMAVALAYLVQVHIRWAPYLTASAKSRRSETFMAAHIDLPAAGLPFDWHQTPRQTPLSRGLNQQQAPSSLPPSLARISQTLHRVTSQASGARMRSVPA